MPRPLARPVRGVSLVELLVGMVIALMVLGIVLQLTLIARERYLRMADEALVDDRGMQALELIGSAVRQAGWVTDTPASSPVRRWPDADAPPSLIGQDDCGSPKMLPTLKCENSSREGNSDALLVRFAGRSDPADIQRDDGAMRDCAGYGVPERIQGEDDPRPGRILLYVSRATTDDEPQLICRSLARNKNQPGAGAANGMVRGVETLQFLYKLAPTATASAATVPARVMTKSDWHRVRQVHVAMVVRGERLAITAPAPTEIALFPEFASATHGTLPQDMRFRPADPRRNRARFSATFTVRNPLRCEVDAC